MKISFLALALFGSTSAFAATSSIDVKGEDVWITTDADAQHLITQHGATILGGFAASPNAVVAKINDKQLAALSSHMHDEKHRCGGYMVHPDKATAMKAAAMPLSLSSFEKPVISHPETVNSLIAQVEPNNMVTTIENLTSFTNRFYTTSTGIAASDWLYDRWSEEIKDVSYASARQITHSEYPQKSVEVTLLGAKHPQEIVVVGGHLDSTVGSWTTEGTISPGADDDASGIATVTESLRLMIASGIQPDRTIKFYGYAAEEVGLRGSQDIAQTLKNEEAKVISALQLDMTNYNGSAHDITFINDYTDSNLTEFLSELIDTYASDITYDFDRCGYACSDHASWHNAGYPAAMPFESMFSDYNSNIHTEHDTLENSDPTASHATKFAKLAIAYLVETSLDDADSPATQLENGIPVENLSSGYFDEQMFVFRTAEAGQVTITITGPNSGDADLYVKYDGAVSQTDYDCRPFQNGSNEQCVFNKPAGEFNIMLRGYRNFDEVDIVASFEPDNVQDKQ
ncbi:M28 family metallopeptidase [Vibrio ostreicida]|uniref:M28 family metallopeptidase n=1 Tax=Vibrio ostreicida TaxID=526588 RepID=A0ABT8BYU8_9VIBR|nr:M28 family metallopeptidase [Vibrio ostreicida]MDN3612341.1 M28 family metallopeptidase [Vibrio ostreicida]NPD08720.1 M20/M25/M40 family metallo-hydrolase [Vibrio ostreicida]